VGTNKNLPMDILLKKFVNEYPFIIPNLESERSLSVNNGFYISGYVDKK
jgi:hypothetical protein